FGGIFFTIWVIVMATTVVPAMGRGHSSFPPVLLLLIAGTVVFVAAMSLRNAGGKWEKLLRATRFAAANQLIYVHRITSPRYPGAIFDVGDGRHAFGNYRRPFAPELDIGSYRYTSGSGKNKSTHTWGYAAIRLPRK